MTQVIGILLLACLLGSIPTGFWLVKAVKGIDIRKKGSGNIGMTNVWRVAGAPWGILTFILDIAKGVIPVKCAQMLYHHYPHWDWLPPLAGLIVLLGSVFSIFLKFKGGKGIGVSVGVFFTLLPFPSLIGTMVFIFALVTWRMISVGSLAGVTTMAALSMVVNPVQRWSVLLAVLAMGIAWYTHRSNLKRIVEGKESKISAGRKKGRKH
jgi:acyl phosphate:glycerol-3-phosphate acyltransferase